MTFATYFLNEQFAFLQIYIFCPSGSSLTICFSCFGFISLPLPVLTLQAPSKASHKVKEYWAQAS